MKTYHHLLILVLLFSCTSPKTDTTALKPPADFFPKEKAQVLVVGTFHLDYPGLDAHKTSEEDKIDVLKEPKKSEVTELVDYIKRFNPSKIAIEAWPKWNATEKLKKYKEGEYRDKRDERYQIAMRLAAELDHDTLYAIDAANMIGELQELDTNYVNYLFEDFDFESDDPYNKYYKDWIEEEDKLTTKVKLLDYFKHINSKESHQYGYGAYLIGDFKNGETSGPDVLSAWWYNRNVRIFRKLQIITESPDDRILMLFGNGHAAVLRQLIECSPEYEFVEFDSL